MAFKIEAKHNAFILFPWDAVYSPGSGMDPLYGIGNRDPGVAPSYGDSDWVADIYAGGGIFARVRSWTLAGNIEYHYGSESIEGPLEITCYAVDYENNIIASEQGGGLTKHGGWYGEAETQDGWFIEPGHVSFDPGTCQLRLWPTIHFPVVYDEGTMGVRFPPPELNFLQEPSRPDGVRFGSRNPGDACLVTCELPLSHDDSFDGTGFLGFELQLGSSSPATGGATDHITGSLTLTPSFWEYDTMDGDGPVYDPDTGLWLRTPPGFPED